MKVMFFGKGEDCGLCGSMCSHNEAAYDQVVKNNNGNSNVFFVSGTLSRSGWFGLAIEKEGEDDEAFVTEKLAWLRAYWHCRISSIVRSDAGKVVMTAEQMGAALPKKMRERRDRKAASRSVH